MNGSLVFTRNLRHSLALLVQPEHDDRDMYAEFLHYQGLAHICVSTAGEAIAIAPRADVIVTALRLPGEIDGFQLIGRLKSDERTRNIPLVVLTACAWSGDLHRAEAAACDVFLSKPCLPHELLRELRRLLAGSKQRVRQTCNEGSAQGGWSARWSSCFEDDRKPGPVKEDETP